jgi:hypothetical protein
MSAEYDVTFGDHGVRLSLPAGADVLLTFLRAYFEPYFRFTQAGSAEWPGWTVRVHLGAAPCRVPADCAVRVDVDRSGGFLRCEGWAVDQEGFRLVQLSPSDVTVQIDSTGQVLRLWGPSEAALRVPCLRVMEDLMTHDLERDGWVFVHASAVVAGNRAVLLCGNKGAGKTTGLCKLLRGFDVAQMANDNCVLRVRDGALDAHGWPSFFKVEVGTIATLAELGRDFPVSVRGLLDHVSALWSVYEKVALYPRQGAARFGSHVDVEARVGCVIFPRFEASHPPGLTRLSMADLVDSFGEYVQGSRHPNHPDWMGLGSLPAATLTAHVDAILSALRDADLFSLRWAPSYEDLLGGIPALRSLHHGVRASRTDVPDDGAWPSLPRLT